MNVSIWINQHNLDQFIELNKLIDFSAYNDTVDVYFLRCSNTMININIDIDLFDRLVQSNVLIIKESV